MSNHTTEQWGHFRVLRPLSPHWLRSGSQPYRYTRRCPSRLSKVPGENIEKVELEANGQRSDHVGVVYNPHVLNFSVYGGACQSVTGDRIPNATEIELSGF